MPSITLGLFQMTLIMRLVRAEMLEVLRTDYIRFARARGLTTRAIHFGHALQNTLVPVITVAGLQFGSVIAFAIITETVFQWPGMGLLFVQAVQNVDIPIMAAYLLMVSLIFVTINLVVDILYTVVDPRLRSTISRGTIDMSDAVVPHKTEQRAARAAAPGWFRRALDSDLFYSFRRSKLTMVAAAVTLLFFLLAIFASVLVGAKSVRPGAAPADQFAHLAALDRRRPEPVPARHRRAGPRRAVRDPLRPAHLAARRRARRGLLRRARHRARADRRLCRRRRRRR